jgi:hypothetical protein
VVSSASRKSVVEDTKDDKSIDIDCSLAAAVALLELDSIPVAKATLKLSASNASLPARICSPVSNVSEDSSERIAVPVKPVSAASV